MKKHLFMTALFATVKRCCKCLRVWINEKYGSSQRRMCEAVKKKEQFLFVLIWTYLQDNAVKRNNFKCRYLCKIFV